jgi:ribosome-associated toxin RatA of RatAB toxin-antitoxin module
MPKVKVERVINGECEKIFGMVTDFENLPNKFPQFFKSVKIVSKDGNSITTEDVSVMGGREMHQTVKHILSPPSIDEVYILSGDAKDSHIVTTYEKTKNGTTKITVDGDIKLAGKLRLVGFMAKGKIENGINQVIEEFAKVAENM